MTTAPPLAEYRTKTQIVMDALTARIVSGELAPGARVVLRPIAEEFNCSEIPVREAVRALASAGMLELVPHGGARVTQLDGRQLIELTEVRGLLEPRATRSAGEAMPRPAIDGLYHQLEAMRGILDGKAHDDYSRLNREFHREILQHCPNRKLVATIHDLWDQAERARAVHRFFSGHIETSFRQHQQIVDAIAERRFDDLEDIARDHNRHGLEAVRRLAAEVDAEARQVGKGRRREISA